MHQRARLAVLACLHMCKPLAALILLRLPLCLSLSLSLLVCCSLSPLPLLVCCSLSLAAL